MNLQQLRIFVWEWLNDKAATYLWADSELNAYINLAIKDAVIRSRCIIDSTTDACCNLSVIAGTADYAINPLVLEIKRVFDATNNRVLRKISAEELDDFKNSWRGDVGNPTHYIDDLNHYGADAGGGRKIRLYPNPIINLTVNMTVYRMPLADLVSDADVPEIPEVSHEGIVYGAVARAYLKHDTDAENITKANFFEQKFTEMFGEKPSARQLEFRRKRRKIHVKGRFM